MENNMDKATPSNEKIQEALELLRRAAVEKKEELCGLMHDQYGDLRDVLGGFGANIGKKAKAAMDDVNKAAQMSQEKVKDAAISIDKCVHDKPWHVIGGVAVGALMLGFLMGKRQ